MKIRIIQTVMYKADQVFAPGLILDMEDEQAAEWIEEGRAIEWADEDKPQPKPRKAKEVSDGNG